MGSCRERRYIMFNLAQFCTQAKDILRFVGYILTLVKVAIPLLIIAFGIFDLGKAVTSGKDDETKKAAKTLMWRAIAGVAIFFIPNLILWLFGTIADYNDAYGKDDKDRNFDVCQTCILKPWSCN